jgi:hypothetical protein
MSFTVNDHWLSALSPVKFVYDFADGQEFKGQYKPIRNNFFYYGHEAFKNFKDATLSKKSALVLTDTKQLQDILTSKAVSYSVGKYVAGSLFLKMEDRFLTTKNNLLYRGAPCGNASDAALMTISLVGDSLAEIRIGSKFIEIDSNYPFTAKLVDSETFGEAQYRRFEIEVANNKIAFKIKTPIGYRFLAFGKDNVLRAVGVELNNTIVNNYHFDAVFQTRSFIDYGFDISKGEMVESKYFNETDKQLHNENLNIKQSMFRNTHYLMECPTLNISLSGVVGANLINLKTNYSSSGVFLPSFL